MSTKKGKKERKSRIIMIDGIPCIELDDKENKIELECDDYSPTFTGFTGSTSDNVTSEIISCGIFNTATKEKTNKKIFQDYDLFYI